MADRGKTIKLFLMDGTANGVIKCTLTNWNGVVYKIPRTELERCKERDDLKRSGVYLLFGTADDTGEDVVYIGQAGARKNGEGILNRLHEHKRNPDKDYWREAVAFMTSDNTFGATEISYLENRFCNMALSVKRYTVKNGIDPSIGNLTEEKISEMEEFIDCAKLMMSTLGYRVFEPLVKSENVCPESQKDDVKEARIPLHMERTIKGVGKVEADGFQTSEGFVVLKGSHISLVDDDTIPTSVKERRKNASVDKNGILKEDMFFSSPTYAAMFVIGKSANGLTRWKTADGRTLKSLEEE